MKDQARYRQQGTAFYLTLLAAAGMLACLLLAGTCRGQCTTGNCAGGKCFTAPSGMFNVVNGQSIFNRNWQPQNAMEAQNAAQVLQATEDPRTIPDLTSQVDASPDRAICMVASFDKNLGKWRVGSGTLIAVHPTENQALVLTCTHGSSSEDGKNFCIFGEGTHPRTLYGGRVLEFDAKADAMVLVIKKPPGIEPIALSKLDIQNGQKVWTVGYRYDRGGGFAQASGRVVPPDGNPNATWSGGTFSTDAEASQGQSGGPILNEYKHVCGVISGGDAGGRTVGTNVAYIRTRFPRLRSWLNGLPPGPVLVTRQRTPMGNTVTRRPMVPMGPQVSQGQLPQQSQPLIPLPADTMDTAPPPMPDQPTPAPVTDLALRLDALEQMAATKADLAQFKQEVLDAIAGIPAAQQGKQGPPGPAGPAGKDGKDAAADGRLDTLQDQVEAIRGEVRRINEMLKVDSDGIARGLPPIYVRKTYPETIDPATGKPKQTVEQVFLGEGFEYRFLSSPSPQK